ncbi:MAG: hypothetical protein K6T83_03285 [Alicyclobacillus sp.]|nr:hypothetical protein [Alicyclobacillus sp.]
MKPYVLIVAGIVTALQIVGPYFYGFANWCNVIQYVSGYLDIGTWCVVAHFLIDYYTKHKPQLKRLEEHLLNRGENHNGTNNGS